MHVCNSRYEYRLKKKSYLILLANWLLDWYLIVMIYLVKICLPGIDIWVNFNSQKVQANIRNLGKKLVSFFILLSSVRVLLSVVRVLLRSEFSLRGESVPVFCVRVLAEELFRWFYWIWFLGVFVSLPLFRLYFFVLTRIWEVDHVILGCRGVNGELW